MAIDPEYSFSNEVERANEEIYNNFKLKEKLHSLYKNISAL